MGFYQRTRRSAGKYSILVRPSCIAANDAVIERINRKSLPDGAKWLAGTELMARGLRGLNDGTATIPRIKEQMRLPAFKYSGREFQTD
jgi:hypothetical protein